MNLPRVESRDDGVFWVSRKSMGESGEIISNELAVFPLADARVLVATAGIVI